MAQKIIRTLIDDLTGEESEEISTHTLLLDGVGVEIDLTDHNYDELMEKLNPYFTVKGARKVRSGTGRPKANTLAMPNRGTATVRAWAQENGYNVSSRGRVPAGILKAYEESVK
ncbi:Lsr2 family protein [Streptomyces olivoreticuli]